MSKTKPDFKRMLLRLPHNRQDYATVRIIAELAGLLSTDLVGTYVEDLSVCDLAEFPNAREFRAGSWQPFSAQQLARDTALAVQEAERLFFENAGRFGSKPSFRVAREPLAVSHEPEVDDIVVVIEPRNPIERATHQFNEFLRAAFRSTSSILLMPGRTRNPSGPVIVIASSPDDPGIATGIDIAASTRERMILVPTRMPNELRLQIQERAQIAGVGLSVREAAFRDGEILLPASVKGRLLILNRRQVSGRPRALQMPTLLVSEAFSIRPPDLR